MKPNEPYQPDTNWHKMFILRNNQTWPKLVYNLSSFWFDKPFSYEPEFEPFLFIDAVIVNWEKIEASQQSNFDILNFDTFNLPYDWASISHFRSKAYRTQKSVGHTIESKVS